MRHVAVVKGPRPPKNGASRVSEKHVTIGLENQVVDSRISIGAGCPQDAVVRIVGHKIAVFLQNKLAFAVG